MSDILHSFSRSLNAPMLFEALPAPHREKLRSIAVKRRFGAGQIIQQRGEPATGFWVIDIGSVSVGQFLPDGEFRGAALLGPGDSWGELALFAGQPRVVDAIAREESEVLEIERNSFERVLAQDPSAMRILLQSLSRQFQETLNLFASIRKGSSRPRIAGLLCNLAGDARTPKPIRITQQELGQLLGLTRATVNAILGELEQKHLIKRDYGQITIINRDQLEAHMLE